MPKLILTEGVRSSLKKPLGTLLQGSDHEIYDELASRISSDKPPRVVFVGDRVSKSALENGVRRDVLIVDNKEKRDQTAPLTALKSRTFRVRNDPGTIGSEAWAALHEAVESGDAVVVVDGEEDLLTLVAITVAPLGSHVVYGQPNEGVVLVRVDAKAKTMARSFMEAMNEIT